MIGAPAIVAINNARQDSTGQVAAFGLAGLLIAIVVIAAIHVLRRRKRDRDINRDMKSKID